MCEVVARPRLTSGNFLQCLGGKITVTPYLTGLPTVLRKLRLSYKC